jgi:O-antigen/teichoic acid export membrane protein
MSASRRIAFGAAAQWVSRAASILLGLILMPLLLGHLPKEEVGIWLLLGQSWAVLGILDLGFGATLTRRIALAKGKSGGCPDTELSHESLSEIGDLVACGRRVYRCMAAGVFVVSWCLGFFYLRQLELHDLSPVTVWTAWTILCACQALTVWASIWTCLLQGVGYVGWDAIISTVINAGTLLCQIICVLLGGGLVSLAIVATVGAIAQRAFTRWFSYKRNPHLVALTGHWNPTVMKGIPSLAIRAWLSSLGTVLVFNTDSFFIASGTGAENIPAFRSAFLIVLNVHILASVFAQSSGVFISQLWQANRREEVRHIFKRNLRIGLCIIGCGGIAILFAGDALFNLWLGPGNYVGVGIVSVFVLLFILEQQSFIISTSCRATEHEPFAGWMMAGGVLKLVAAVPMMNAFGLIGLALATLLSQMVTAHWFVAYRGMHRLEFGFTRYLSSVLLPCIGVFLAAAAASYVATQFAGEQSNLIKTLASSLSSGAVLMIALWFLALNRDQRARLMSSAGLHRLISA